MREESTVVQQARTNTVWFGPIMQWGYATYNLPSPPMQPLLWVPVDLFAKSDENMYFDRFMDSHYETLIFFKDDFMCYSQEELSRIGMAYDVDDSFHTLTVAHLKEK
jgi:bacillopeptidase F (M6 metalloprotease family)